jgi:tetratricopeptide (TPR) repeat protein
MTVTFLVVYLLVSAEAESTSWAKRVSELRLLLQQKKFGELDKAVVESQERFDRSLTTEDEPWATMGAFLPHDEPTATALSEWVAQKPGSYAALAARASYYEATGWSVRGTKSIRDTESGQLRTMNAMHALAEADCQSALALRPTIVRCHVALVNIAKGNGEADRARRRYDEARRALPSSVLVATARLESLTPRWGGSYAAMEIFLAQLAKEPVARTSAGRALMGQVKADQAWVAAINEDRVKAIELYTEAIAAGGGNAAYHAGRGVNAQRLRRNAEALRDFSRAIELSPRGWPYSEYKLPNVLASRAAMRYAGQEQVGAETDIRDALTLDPRDSYVLGWAKRILPKTGP